MRKLYKNGKIYVEKDLFVDSILIDNGKIERIGKVDDLINLAYDELIDLGGSTVLPGLNDSHLHISMIGYAMNSPNLTLARSIEDVIQIGKDFLGNNPGLESLQGRGWNQDYFIIGDKRLPNRYDLDKISVDIPIVFDRICGHVAVGNSKALEILSIDSNTIVDGGEIILDANGIPTGVFNENAVRLIQSAIPEKSKELRKKEFVMAMKYALSQGLTSVQSCDVMGKDYKLVFETINELFKDNELKFRYTHQFNFQDINDFKDYLKTENNNSVYDEQFFSKGALKLFKDGSLGARTAHLKNEYNDAKGEYGVQALSDEQLQELFDLATASNIQVVTHAIGDAAIESVINAYEKTMIDGKNSLRHGIVHNQITSLEQLKRIVKLSIPVMYQPIFLDYDNKIIIDRVGEELAATSYAFNTLYRLGAPVSLGTDAPVEDCNPFANIYCAVNRKGLDGTPKDGYFPEENMSVTDAIDAYTIGSAYNEFKEDFKGRLKPGYVADFIILDRDIFTIDPMEIKDIKVLETIVAGNSVYKV